jgi:signal transduction histidine kinase
MWNNHLYEKKLRPKEIHSRHLRANYFLIGFILLIIMISLMQGAASVIEKEQYPQVTVHNWIEEKTLFDNPVMQQGESGGIWRSLQFTMMLLAPAIVVLFGLMSWLWSLKRQVNIRTKDLKEAIAEREKLQDQRERFMSVITHELRTPLVSIDGYMDYIYTGKLGPIPEKVESCLKVVRQESSRLLSLTNDLLDLRRLEFGKFQLEKKPLNYREVIDHCTHEIQPLIEEKRQQFKVDVAEDQLTTNGDRNRLCQVLINLLSNATKFTPEGSEIILQVEKAANNIRTQVSDTGIGIREEDLGKVFEAFTNIKKPTHIKGTGLGLSITKGLVEAHGGKIWVESEGEGKGTTFTFTIPEYENK